MLDRSFLCLWQNWSVRDVAATSETAAVVAPVAATAMGKGKRERYTAAAASVAVEAAAAEMEEIAEARFGQAPAEEMDKPEVPRGFERAMMRIYPPCSFGKWKIVYYPGWNSPPHSPV